MLGFQIGSSEDRQSEYRSNRTTVMSKCNGYAYALVSYGQGRSNNHASSTCFGGKVRQYQVTDGLHCDLRVSIGEPRRRCAPCEIELYKEHVKVTN